MNLYTESVMMCALKEIEIFFKSRFQRGLFLLKIVFHFIKKNKKNHGSVLMLGYGPKIFSTNTYNTIGQIFQS